MRKTADFAVIIRFSESPQSGSQNGTDIRTDYQAPGGGKSLRLRLLPVPTCRSVPIMRFRDRGASYFALWMVPGDACD